MKGVVDVETMFILLLNVKTFKLLMVIDPVVPNRSCEL